MVCNIYLGKYYKSKSLTSTDINTYVRDMLRLLNQLNRTKLLWSWSGIIALLVTILSNGDMQGLLYTIEIGHLI